MQSRRALVLLFSLWSSGALLAQAPSSAEVRPIDVERSTLTVLVFRAGVFSFAGDNHEVRAPISAGTVDSARQSVEFTVDARKMEVLDPKLDPGKRKEVQAKMMSSDVLDPDRFPEVKFRSTRVEPGGKGAFRVTGELTLHGETKPLTVTVTSADGRYSGSATLKQTDFGMKPVSVGGGTVKVKDELKINFDIVTKP
jgi:polyisoprenoid-binding protein YceI